MVIYGVGQHRIRGVGGDVGKVQGLRLDLVECWDAVVVVFIES